MEDVESLAAHLLGHAQAARNRHAAIEAHIAAEEVQARHADEQADALRAEIAQYRGWLDGELGGSSYRMSKAIHDERERRAMLEGELGLLRERLASASASLARLQNLGQNSAPAQQARAADGALAQLKRLHDLSSQKALTEAPSEAPP